MVPITGINRFSAEIALVSYTLLILFRNTLTGLRGVPRPAIDAAQAMGLTPAQSLVRIELPLALPAIMAGLRIATVTTISLTTVAAFIGVGGLGTARSSTPSRPASRPSSSARASWPSCSHSSSTSCW